jgi:hypothetical protein
MHFRSSKALVGCVHVQPCSPFYTHSCLIEWLIYMMDFHFHIRSVRDKSTTIFMSGQAMLSAMRQGTDAAMYHTSCLFKSKIPFMSRCISRTASTAAERGVSGVFRTGAAVFTSTSHRVSGWAGIGSSVFKSACGLMSDKSHACYTDNLYREHATAKRVATFIELRSAPMCRPAVLDRHVFSP